MLSYEEYKKVREEGDFLTAQSAVRVLRARQQPKTFQLSWECGERSGAYLVAQTCVSGYALTAQVLINYDSLNDLGCFGRFVREWEPGALRVPPALIKRFGRGRSRDNYYIPSVSYEELFAYFHDAGYSKAEADVRARKAVREELVEAFTYGETWNLFDMVVEARKYGVLLGQAAICQIAMDDWDNGWADTLIQEAVTNANAMLKKLCAWKEATDACLGSRL